MVLNKTQPQPDKAHEHFNLIENPWIPVRLAEGGRHALLGLDEIFRKADAIEDLDCAPHERIALMRLLVCITHAALGAPESPEEWQGFGSEIATKVPAYLNRAEIKPHFNLLGDGPRFLQVPLKETKQKPLLEFLEFKFANGPVFLDHDVGIPKQVPPHKLALNFLCFQNFFIGGGMGSAKNGGVEGNGPSLKFLHTYLIGSNLLETIVLNCLLKEHAPELGTPAWDSSIQASPSEFLRRMAPMPCHVWLRETDLWITQGTEYHLEEGSGENRRLIHRDPYATLEERKDKVGLLRADVSKSLWRDVHLFLEIRQIIRNGESAAPRNLISHAETLMKHGVTLWAGELIKAKDAKVVDMVESTFTIPSAMLGEDGRSVYRAGVEFAETQSFRLKLAVTEYVKAMKSESAPDARAQNRYWHTLDRESPLLLALAADPPKIAYAEKGNPWGDLVRAAAREAYEATCPRQTPRQIQAFAEGLKKLPIPKPKPQST
jgi:CRISPR system Cascade subunit CasA